MKSVSIEELKRELSTLVREASAGARILITRHNSVVAALGSADLDHVHVGSSFGSGTLRPALAHATRGHYLRVLDDDRRGDDAQ